MKKFGSFYLILIFVFIFGYSSFAQSKYKQTIRGCVVDNNFNAPLPGVYVMLVNSNPQTGTVTDSDGNFELENIPVGRRDLLISCIGYKSVSLRDIYVSSGKETVLKIELTENIIRLDEVVIKAFSRKDLPLNETALVSARSFTVAETEKYAGTWGDPARMVSNYAGIVAAGDQRNDIIIRGNSPLGLLWRLEGVDIPNPNHYGTLGTTGGSISILNNNLLTNSDFYTGAFPAEYGNAISGVFDLKMRKGNNKKREYMAQFGFNGFELGAEGPFVKNKKASYLINYRYTMMNLMDAIGFNSYGGIPEYQDLSFKLNFPTSKAGIFSIFGIGGLSSMKIAVKDEDAEDGGAYTSEVLDKTKVNYGSDMGVTGLSHKYFFNNTLKLNTNITVSGCRSKNDVDSLKDDGNFQRYYNDEYSEVKYSFSGRLTKKLNVKNNLYLGLSYDTYEISYFDEYYESDIDNFINLTNTKGQLGLFQSYLKWLYKFSDNFTFSGGIHFQQFNLNGDYSIEPRVSIKKELTEKQSLSFGYGMHSQLQARINYFTETLIDSAAFNYVKTNQDMGFSKSHQIVLGYDYLPTKNLRLKIETYYQYLYNIPVEQKESYFSMINYGADFYSKKIDSLVNEGTGKNYGIELTIEKFLSKNYYFLLTSSIFESKYKGSDNIERNSAFNGNFVINALCGYNVQLGKHNNTLSINLRNVFAGGRRYIPVNFDASELSGKTEYDYDNAYINKYDNFFRLDFKISYKKNSAKLNQTFSVEIMNITDHKNIFSQDYDPGSDEIITSYQTGFFPVMSYKIQF